MKRKILYTVLFLFAVSVVAAWVLLSSATRFADNGKFVYVYEGKDAKQQFLQQVKEQDLIARQPVFIFIANQLNIWQKIQPGRFEIRKGQSLLSIIRMLRNNYQSPVRLVINKLRTKEELAKMIGKNFKADSANAIAFLSNNDSLNAFSVDSNSLLTIIIPDTYQFKWNTPVTAILQRLQTASVDFWHKNDRPKKAEKLGLSAQEVYTLASITEEETNKNEEKGNIASVYLNRLRKNMYLGADPTIKFALKDFSLKRILFVHLHVASPFNTYRNKGLPPGPICTPSVATIDAVLNQPATDYLFFVADSSLNGFHHFSNTYEEHLTYAKAYQRALDEWLANKQNP